MVADKESSGVGSMRTAVSHRNVAGVNRQNTDQKCNPLSDTYLKSAASLVVIVYLSNRVVNCYSLLLISNDAFMYTNACKQ